MIECDFNYAGCEVRLPRKDMPGHVKDGIFSHLSLLAVSHKRQQDEIEALRAQSSIQIEQQQNEIEILRKEVNQLKVYIPI